MVISLKKKNKKKKQLPSKIKQPMSTSVCAALIHNDLFTPEAFISFSCELPALIHRTPGFSFIRLLRVFALFCFNLCFPLFFHQRVQPHGGLCVLDLMKTEQFTAIRQQAVFLSEVDVHKTYR